MKENSVGKGFFFLSWSKHLQPFANCLPRWTLLLSMRRNLSTNFESSDIGELPCEKAPTERWHHHVEVCVLWSQSHNMDVPLLICLKSPPRGTWRGSCGQRIQVYNNRYWVCFLKLQCKLHGDTCFSSLFHYFDEN